MPKSPPPAKPRRAPLRKARTKPSTATNAVVCENCGTHAPGGTAQCSQCGKGRFAPAWVRELRRVNRSVAVQVTDPHPASGGDAPRVTLYKWWPGGNATFNIPNQQQWERIKVIIDTELAPLLGWSPPPTIVGGGRASRQTAATVSNADLESIARTEPRRLTQLLRSVDLSKVTDNDVEQIAEALAEIAEILVGADEGLRRAIRRIVALLPSQGEGAIRELSSLMESLTLAQIATVTREVHRRLGLLDLFRERALDDRTYEIRGDGSIHRLLEQAMWIVDERYWIMHSNRSLRTVIGDQLAKEDKRFEAVRPDFVCGTIDRRLIIIELKRPSHVLEVADLNQLERYIVLCNEYSSDHNSFEAILVGSKQSEDLRKTLAVRGGNRFQVRTYTDLISDSERRYKRYLDAVDADSMAS